MLVDGPASDRIMMDGEPERAESGGRRGATQHRGSRYPPVQRGGVPRRPPQPNPLCALGAVRGDMRCWLCLSLCGYFLLVAYLRNQCEISEMGDMSNWLAPNAQQVCSLLFFWWLSSPRFRQPLHHYADGWHPPHRYRLVYVIKPMTPAYVEPRKGWSVRRIISSSVAQRPEVTGYSMFWLIGETHLKMNYTAARNTQMDTAIPNL